MIRARALLPTLVLALAGPQACLLTNDFFGFEDDAPIVAVEEPEGFPGEGFGAAVAGHGSRTLGGLVAVGGYEEVFVFRAESAGGGPPPDAEYFRVCERSGDCAGQALADSLAWVASFSTGSDCVAVGIPRADTVVLVCADGSARTVRQEAGGTFGTAVASVPSRGEIFVGAPGSVEKVFVWSGDDPGTLGSITLTETTGRLGEALAAVDVGGHTRLAIGDGDARVVVVWDEDAAGETGRITGGLAGFGSALAWGSTTDDPDPVLHVGGDGEVRIYAETDTGEVEAGDGMRLDCPGDCDGFGDALAVGDVNDGGDDLLVGWPGRPTGGVEGAGAVALFDHGLSSDPVILRDSTPDGNSALGRAVAVVPVSGHDEPVVGAQGEILYFFCTGLAGDIPGAGPRCR